jgi:hypothetical protein
MKNDKLRTEPFQYWQKSNNSHEKKSFHEDNLKYDVNLKIEWITIWKYVNTYLCL